jgi:hypothetical protein
MIVPVRLTVLSLPCWVSVRPARLLDCSSRHSEVRPWVLACRMTFLEPVECVLEGRSVLGRGSKAIDFAVSQGRGERELRHGHCLLASAEDR